MAMWLSLLQTTLPCIAQKRPITKETSGMSIVIADLEMLSTPGQVSESRNPKTFKGLRVPIRATI